MNRPPRNRSARRKFLSEIADAPDVALRFAADMKVATGLHKQGRMKEAVDLYRKIVKIYEGLPDIRVAWSNLGATLQVMGKLEDAVHALKKARSLQPDAPAPHHNLGMALAALGRMNEAIDSLVKAVMLEPGFNDAWVGLGLACEKVGDFSRAEQACRDILETRPDAILARYYLSNMMLRALQFQAAADGYRACLLARPDFAEAAFALGRALDLAGDAGGAAAAFLEAAKLAPDVEPVHEQMARTLKSLAERDAEAAKALALQWRTLAPESPSVVAFAPAIVGEAEDSSADEAAQP